MKALFLLNAYERDGPGILLHGVMSRLAGDPALEIHTAALSRGGPLEENIRALGIPTRVIGMKHFFDWRRYLELRAFISEHKFDVVHTSILRADLIGRRAARAAGVPVIVSTEHGVHAWEHRGGLIRYLVRKAWLATLPYTSRIIAVSGHVRRALIAEGVPSEKILVIPNGIATEKFKPATPEEKERIIQCLSVEKPAYIIGCAANLIPMKGIGCVLDAMPEILKRHPGTLLVLAGDGPLMDDLKRHAVERGIASQVRFIGRVTALLPGILASLDVFIQASLNESFGLAAAEALCCGVPVVASNVGGLPEVVPDGVCGRLIPPGNVQAMIEAVSGLLADPEQIRIFGDAGRAHVLERFDIGRTARQYLETYTELQGMAPVSIGSHEKEAPSSA